MKIGHFSILVLIFFFTSCSSHPNKKAEAMQFLSRIDNIYDTLDAKGNKFDQYFRAVALIAKSHSNYQPDSAKIDTLKSYFEEYITSYEIGLLKLETMKEFDDSFQFIKLNTLALKNFRESWMSIIPTYLKVFKVGWKDATESERTIIISVPTILEKYSKVSDELSNQLNSEGIKLGKKYNFKYIPKNS